MPWNFLIIPLVAGYYLLTRSYFFKFQQQRLDRQRLIFESILLAVLLSVLTFVVRIICSFFFPDFCNFLYNCIPIKTPYIGTSIFILLFALILSNGLNYFLNKEKYVKKAIKNVGNEFELILKSSFSDGFLLQFTLDNDKFYIAWVKELPIPAISNFIRVIPAISGYRNSTKELEFTSHYLTVYSEYVREGKIQNIQDLNVDLIIDLSHIISVSYFDPEMYNRFNALKENK